MDKDKALNYSSSRQQEGRKGGKGTGLSSKKTRRRMERERKEQEELHAMDKPKPLEVVSDGDLSEVKKDPEETKKAWEVWLKEKDSVSGKQSEDGLPDKKHNWNDWKYISQRVRDEVLNEFKQRRKKSYITKPIPDSKGGRGSFQHCINANKDKKNPGGWCKQIERKIGKGLGALGEGKLNRKTGKPMKLKPRKITLDEFESEKPIDEKARKKRETKKKTDYFVEEIRSNIIYHNKILPILGMIAGQVGRGVTGAAKKIGPKLLADVGAVGQDMIQQEEEEEQ